MGNKIDVLGKVFGRLIVLEEAGRNKSGHILWKCLCDCGNIVTVRGCCLRKGDTKSCGCLNVERVSEACKVDLKGHRFGRLTVLEDVGRDKWYSVLWKCSCDCGNELVVCSSALGSGNTQSCGCLQKERSSENKGMNSPRYKHGLSGTKEYDCAKSQKRHANKRNQTPSDANLDLIQLYYTVSETMEGYEVDHIKPLSKGGLHHEDNLQLLDKKLNREKFNKWPLTEEEKIKYKGIRL
jgi:hypothetical protein